MQTKKSGSRSKVIQMNILLGELSTIIREIIDDIEKEKEYRRKEWVTTDMIIGGGIGYFLKLNNINVKDIFLDKDEKIVVNEEIDDSFVLLFKEKVKNFKGIQKTTVELYLINTYYEKEDNKHDNKHNSFYEKELIEPIKKEKESCDHRDQKGQKNNNLEKEFKQKLSLLREIIIVLLSYQKIYLSNYRQRQQQVETFAKYNGVTYKDLEIILEKNYEEEIPEIKGTVFFDSEVEDSVKMFKLDNLIENLKIQLDYLQQKKQYKNR